MLHHDTGSLFFFSQNKKENNYGRYNFTVLESEQLEVDDVIICYQNLKGLNLL